MMPTPPLGLRNRLAETILSALGDAAARRELQHVAVSEDVDWIRDALPEHAALVRARARRASEALATCPLFAVEPGNEGRHGSAGASRASGVWGPGSAPMVVDRAMSGPPMSLAGALGAAATLFDAGLHFEVHELLEPHWVRAHGAERQALQGLIQVAVGFQHLANGNLEGARSLLAEGSRRLREGRLRGLDLDRFADAVSGATSRLAEPVVVPPFPRTT